MASSCARSPDFTLFLAIYDIFFTRVIALTPVLAVALQGRPLDPSVGFAAGAYNANVGLGDLLVFCLFTIAAYKGHGRRGAVTALGVIAVFGAVAPSVTPLVAPGLFGTTAAAFVPIQALFGPAAFVAYRWLARTDARPGAVLAAARRTRPVAGRRAGLALPGLAIAGLIFATIAGSGDVAATSAAAAPTTRARRSRCATSPSRPARCTSRSGRPSPGPTTTACRTTSSPRRARAFGSANLLEHATFRFRALRPGTIRYECTLHQGMRGTIVVSRDAVALGPQRRLRAVGDADRAGRSRVRCALTVFSEIPSRARDQLVRQPVGRRARAPRARGR